MSYTSVSTSSTLKILLNDEILSENFEFEHVSLRNRVSCGPICNASCFL